MSSSCRPGTPLRRLRHNSHAACGHLLLLLQGHWDMDTRGALLVAANMHSQGRTLDTPLSRYAAVWQRQEHYTPAYASRISSNARRTVRAEPKRLRATEGR